MITRNNNLLEVRIQILLRKKMKIIHNNNKNNLIKEVRIQI